MRDPHSAMATFVLAQIDTAVSLFTSLTQQHGTSTPRYQRNLLWLLKLRARASSKMSTASSTQKADWPRNADDLQRSSEDREDGDGDGDDEELVGWRTRLIERASKDRRQTNKTIRFTATPTGSQAADVPDLPLNVNDIGGNQPHLEDAGMMMSNSMLPFAIPDSTDGPVK